MKDDPGSARINSDLLLVLKVIVSLYNSEDASRTYRLVPVEEGLSKDETRMPEADF